jgi:hypothetical protein
MPSEALAQYAGLGLNDEDYAWTGAIVTYWALAESELDTVIFNICQFNNPARKLSYRAGFKTKLDYLEKLLTNLPSEWKVFTEIGRALIAKGYKISLHRNIVAHWIQQRGPSADSAKFLRVIHEESVQTKEKGYTQEDISDVTIDIMKWTLDLRNFVIFFWACGPLKENFHSDSDDYGWHSIEWDRFCSIEKDSALASASDAAEIQQS